MSHSDTADLTETSSKDDFDRRTGARRNPPASFRLPPPGSHGGWRRAPSSIRPSTSHTRKSTSAASPEAEADLELVQAHQLGHAISETAFRELYERYQGRVYRICLRIMGNPNDALDACQETFVRVFANLHRFRGRSRLSGWIHSIAVNASLELRRVAGRRHLLSLETASEGPGGPVVNGQPVDSRGESPEFGCLRHELEQSIRCALRQTPRVQRETVVLRYIEGLSYSEVAEVLGVPVGTVKSRLARAHQTLERCLSEDFDQRKAC